MLRRIYRREKAGEPGSGLLDFNNLGYFDVQAAHIERIKYRVISFVATIIYIPWSIMTAWVFPEAIDPWGLRIAVNLIFLCTFVLTFTDASLRMLRWAVTISCMATSLHEIILMHINSFDPYFNGVLMMVLTVSVAVIDRSRKLYFYFAVVFAALTLTVSISTAPFSDKAFVIILAFTMMSFVVLSTWEDRKLRQLSKTALSHFDLTIKTLQVGLITQDNKGRIINSNPAALKVFSSAKTDVTSFESLFSSRQFFDEKENGIDQKDLPPNVVLRTQQKVEDFLVGVRASSGDICWLQMSSVPLVDDENAVIGVVTSFADITSLRKAQKDLEVHNALLFNASKLSSLGEMAAGIAHEINNPLAIVALRTEELNANLQQDTVDKSHLLKISKNIIDAVFRISRIIKSLKTFSRDNSAEPMQWHSFDTILDDVKNILAQKIHLESIELHIAEELRRSELYCRNTQLSQVLLNLIVNSCDAIKHRDEKWIKIHCEMDEEHFYINVDDSGDAIPAETVDKIFEPFFTTKSVGEGTGLGLHIVRSLLQHNKATISYMRVENATRFRIKFPKDSWRKGEHAGTIHETSY